MADVVGTSQLLLADSTINSLLERVVRPAVCSSLFSKYVSKAVIATKMKHK